MTTPVTPIAAAPVVPDRTNRTVFPSQSFNWYTWMHDSLYPGINSQAAATYDNALTALAAVQAKGLSNQYKGIYAAGTTYAQGDCVVYNNTFYLSNVAGNVGNTPSSSPTQWAAVSQLRYAGVSNTVNASVTLNNGSPAVQRFAHTTPGWTVTLPDLTTFPAAQSAPFFILCNDGLTDLKVLDSAGVCRGFCPPGGQVQCEAYDVSTATGGWQLDGANLFGITASYENTALTLGTGTQSLKLVQVDTNRTALAYSAGGNTYAFVYDASANAWGSPVLLDTGNGVLDLVAISSTQYAAVVNNGGKLKVCPFTVGVSGTTVTAGTASGVGDTLSTFFGTVVLGTSLLTCYSTATATSICAVSIGSNTATLGTATVIRAVTQAAQILSFGTTAVVLAYNGTNNAISTYTVSGTTIALGTTVTIAGTLWSTTTQVWKTLPSPVANSFMLVNQNSTTNWLWAQYTVTGTSIAAAGTGTLTATASDPNTSLDCSLVNGRLLVAYYTANEFLQSYLFSFAPAASAVALSLASAVPFTGATNPPVIPAPTTGATSAKVMISSSSATRVYQIDCSTATPSLLGQRHLLGTGDINLPARTDSKGRRNPQTLTGSMGTAAIPIWSSGAYNKRNVTLMAGLNREFEVIQDLPEYGSNVYLGLNSYDAWVAADSAAANANGGLFLQRFEMANP